MINFDDVSEEHSGIGRYIFFSELLAKLFDCTRAEHIQGARSHVLQNFVWWPLIVRVKVALFQPYEA